MESAIQQGKILANSPEMKAEIKTIHELQKSTVLFWDENPHYGTLQLHANHKLDAQFIREEMDLLKSKYKVVD